MDPALPMVRIYRDGRVAVVPSTPPSLHDPVTGVASKDVTIHPDAGPPVPARLYLPPFVSNNNNNKKKKKLPVVIYYHGGGFTLESAFSPTFHPYLNSLANNANALVVSVEYRLAPEHPIPAAYDDAWAALQWVASASGDEWVTDHADLASVFLAGDSAGANIAHNTAMRAGGDHHLKLKLKGVVLVHPFFWGPKRMGRESGQEQGSILKPQAADRVWPLVCPTAPAGEEDPRLNPLVEGAPSLKMLGCERVLVCVAGKDLLAERGRAYCEGVKGSGWGGEMELLVSEDEDHAFHLSKVGCDKGKEVMKCLVAFFNRC